LWQTASRKGHHSRHSRKPETRKIRSL